MYYMFMDTMQIPIPPESMLTKIKNKNKVIELINSGEINILKAAGLTEISFKMLLPNQSYPFNHSLLNQSARASTYLDQLEKFKTSKKPFQFIVVRMTDGGELLSMTNIKMTLEEYSIDEDAKEGYDFYANVTLKQYKEWGAKKIETKTGSDGKTTGTITKTRETTGKTTPDSIIAKKGDTLQTICKKYVVPAAIGLASQMSMVKALNKIAIPAVLAAGQVIKLVDKEKAQNGGYIMH